MDPAARPGQAEPTDCVGRGPGSIVLIDNYDSFTYNLVHLFASCGREVEVVVNDALCVEQLVDTRPQALVLSAGPGVPAEAGITLQAIQALSGVVPIFGICLGLQAIAEAFGGQLMRAQQLLHGKTCEVLHQGTGLYRGIPNRAAMARYNSLLVSEPDLPDCLEVTARSAQGEVMGLRHRSLPVEGVQFHPESVLSAHGPIVVRNWLEDLSTL